MRKEKNHRHGGWASLPLALIILLGCTAKPGAEDSPLVNAKTGAQTEVEDSTAGFGDAVRLPAIGLRDWTYLIAYKPDGTGYFEAYGDDTSILRAGGIDIGVLEENELLLGGERKLAEYSSSRILAERIFSQLKQGELKDRFLVLQAADGGLRVEGEEGRSLYSRTAEGGLRIERSGERGFRLEEYRPDGSSRLSLDGKLAAEGGLREQNGSLEYFERSIEDKDGVLELFYTIEHLEADRYRSEVGSVEPIAWVLIENLSSIMQGERPLENLAILDQVMGPYRRITPLLALSYFGKLSANR